MKKYRMGDIAKFINGRAYLMPELLNKGKYKIVRVGNFSGKNEWFYSDFELEEDKYCSKGDLLYKWACNFGPEIWHDEKVIYHYHIWKVINDSNIINKFYLYYYFKYKTPYWLGTAHGSTMIHITKENMENIEVSLPSLPEQERIAKVLSDIDSKIALNKKINCELETMAKEIYDYCFVQFCFPNEEGKPYKSSGGKMQWNDVLKREIPAGWEVRKLGEIAEVITKGTTPSTLGFNFIDKGINFVKVECIEKGQIIFNNLMHISQETNQKLKRSQLHEKDILITIAGRLASSCIVPYTILPANTNQAVGIVRLKKEYLNFVLFLYFHISSPLIQNKLKNILRN